MQFLMQEYALIRGKIQSLRSGGKPVVAALDGNSGAGKSTLAAHLAADLDAAVFHMDDYFLPPELRTPERLSIPGGNIDAERFCAEIIRGIRSAEEFGYQVFSCRDNSYTKQRARRAPIYILEGVYSLHPMWQAAVDLKLFLSVSPEEQVERILRRNGPEALQTFREKWIPMENRYFEAFRIPECCDFVICTDQDASV